MSETSPRIRQLDTIASPTTRVGTENPPILKRSISSTETMRELLERSGIIFYPRVREIMVPVINAVKIAGLVGEANIPQLQRVVGQLKAYLETQAVVDKWGSDHVGRRTWRQEMMTQYGDPFKAVYDNNQLRANIITPVFEAFVTLSRIVPKHRQDEFHAALTAAQQHLKPITDESKNQNGNLIKGEEYNNMETGVKIWFVQELEDHILAVLSTLSKGHTSKKPQRMLIT